MTGRCRPTPLNLGETSDGLMETGGDLSNETLEGPVLGVFSPQAHQTPRWRSEKKVEERAEVWYCEYSAEPSACSVALEC